MAVREAMWGQGEKAWEDKPGFELSHLLTLAKGWWSKLKASIYSSVQ
jgi:hypothetical protein